MRISSYQVADRCCRIGGTAAWMGAGITAWTASDMPYVELPVREGSLGFHIGYLGAAVVLALLGWGVLRHRRSCAIVLLIVWSLSKAAQVPLMAGHPEFWWTTAPFLVAFFLGLVGTIVIQRRGLG